MVRMEGAVQLMPMYGSKVQYFGATNARKMSHFADLLHVQQPHFQQLLLVSRPWKLWWILMWQHHLAFGKKDPMAKSWKTEERHRTHLFNFLLWHSNWKTCKEKQHKKFLSEQIPNRNSVLSFFCDIQCFSPALSSTTYQSFSKQHPDFLPDCHEWKPKKEAKGASKLSN